MVVELTKVFNAFEDQPIEKNKMPLDINLFRQHAGGNPDLIRESQRRRFASVEIVDEIISHDDKWRYLTGSIDNMKKKRNQVQKEVATKMKAKEPCDDLVAEIKKIGEEINAAELEQQQLKIMVDSLISKVGNIVDDSVPVSKDEDADNKVVRRWGNPRDPTGLLNHHDLLWRIGGYEPERGVNVAGHRGYFLRDVGVMLNQAFINYGIAFLRAKGYCCLQPPFMMKKELMAGVAQLEQFDEELYKVGGDNEEKYLIATSEQPICGYHYNEWLDEKQLPLRYAGISTCFRKEAGAHGKDTWGIFRVHQFEKVEQFVICESDLEKSQTIQEEMIAAAEEFYKSLGFPYQVISIVSGALNNAAIRKYDLEAWFPGYNTYRELVSCSNCTDYQSRAMEIRCGAKKLDQREKKYVHMLNSTLCATGRAICCLLETYQDKDGVHIPEVLVPFMGGMTFLPFVRESRLSPSDTKTAKSTVTPTVPAVLAPVASVSSTVSASIDPSPLGIAITAKGEEIRVLKANKGDKDAIKVLVSELTTLKSQFKQENGYDFGSTPSTHPPSSVKVAVSETKQDIKPEIKVEVESVKVTKPSYTSPALVRKVLKDISIADLFQEGKLSLFALDSRLLLNSYVGGYLPSPEDDKVFDIIKSEALDLSGFMNASRWLRNMTAMKSE